MPRCILSIGILLVIVFITGCSGGTGALQPSSPEIPGGSSTIPEEHQPAKDENSQRVVWGVYDITFDPVENTALITPSRDAAKHFNVTSFVTPPNCNNCVGVFVEGYNPDGWVYDIRVTLKNPFTLTGFDVRGTLLIGGDSDTRRMVNADEYTEMFDDTLPADRNPFKVFATDMSMNIFTPGSTHEVNYHISFPPPPQFNVSYVVDASWPTNQKEPYTIFDQEIDGELDTAGNISANVTAYVSDWQDDVEYVKLDVTPLGAPAPVDFINIGGDLWRIGITNDWAAPAGDYELWIEATSGDSPHSLFDKINVTLSVIENSPPVWDDTIGITGLDPMPQSIEVQFGSATDPDIPPDDPVTYNIYCSETTPVDFGSVTPINVPSSPAVIGELLNGQEYFVAVRAMDSLLLEETNTVEMSATPRLFDLEDITPDWLNFNPRHVSVSGDYVYVAGGPTGLHIFDITNPVNPVWVSKVDVSYAEFVIADGDYAYVLSSDDLIIVDVSTPASPSIIKTVLTSFYRSNLCIADGYAYLCGYAYGIETGDVHVIDIDPPASASIITTVPIPANPMDVYALGNTAYVACNEENLYFIDITTPSSASIYSDTVDVSNTEYSNIVVQGDYAYVQGYYGNLLVIDVSSIGSASVVKTLDVGGSVWELRINGDYAYAVADSMGLRIIDISVPASASILNTINYPRQCMGGDVNDDYAYVASFNCGLYVIDISPPGSASIAGYTNTPGRSKGVDVNGDYAYIGGILAGVQMLDISDPYNPAFVNNVITPDAFDPEVRDGYCFLADFYGDFMVIDIDPIESASTVTSITNANVGQRVHVDDTYAYYIDRDPG